MVVMPNQLAAGKPFERNAPVHRAGMRMDDLDSSVSDSLSQPEKRPEVEGAGFS